MNPFLHDNPVPHTHFFDRRQAVRRLKGRLLSHGQSSAVVGEPHMGKTSLLHYLASPERRAELYGDRAEGLVFSFLDSHLFPHKAQPADFWARALAPLAREGGALRSRLDDCRRAGFATAEVEDLLAALVVESRRLVLLVDEFDYLLNHPGLNTPELFGALRSLVSRSNGAFSLVVGSRLPVWRLHEATHGENPEGSPFFNILGEITLGSFPDADVKSLLDLAGERFTAADRQGIREVAGGHPFLLQAAAAALWEAGEEGLEAPEARRAFMARQLRREQRAHFHDTWRLWGPEMRRAFAAAALTHTAQLLPDRRFLASPFERALRESGPELDDLEAVGLLRRAAAASGGWKVTCQAMLWWLADELARTVRGEQSFEEWLRLHEMDGVLTRQERAGLGKALDKAWGGIAEGASALVEAFAKGLGESLAGRVG